MNTIFPVVADVTCHPSVTHLNPRSVNRIHELDGLRGLLALFVVCFHLSAPLPSWRDAMGQWAPFMLQGWYAVDVFFLISGFVMLHVYGNTFAERTSWRSFMVFMRARLARLYPVHIAALLVLLAGILPFILRKPELAAVDGRYSWQAFAESLLMLHGPWVAHRTWNYPAWSISAEWHAYLIFPFLVPLLRKMTTSMALATVTLAAIIPFTIYVQGLLPDQYPTNGLIVLARAIPLFIGGMGLHILHKEGRVMSWPLAWLATLGTLLCLCVPRMAAVSVLLTPLLMLTVLENDSVRRVFRSAPLLWLGKISYSLYMTHALVDIFFIKLADKAIARVIGTGWLLNTGPAFLLWLVAIWVALIVGWATWNWVEVPGRRFVLKFLALKS